MLNIERYKDEIREIGIDDFGVVNGKPVKCYSTNCGRCDFVEYVDCSDKTFNWLLEECKESRQIDWDNDIDWERVPVNTSVIVYDFVDDMSDPVRGYFAMYLPNSNRRYFTFSDEKKKKDAIGFIG